MEEEEPIAAGGGWKGKTIGVVVTILIITNLITAVTVFYAFPQVIEVEVPGEQPPPPVPTLTVIGPWSGAEMDAFLPVLDAFKAKTGIDYEYLIFRQEDLRPILPAQFSAQQTPGDVIFMVSSFIQDVGPQGDAVDVTGLISESDFRPGALDPVKVGDTIYGGVYTGKVKPGFWYKKSFFAANNLNVPTTFQEFQDLLATIQNLPGIVNPIVSGDGVGWPLSDVTEHFIATYGGPQMHRDLTAGTIAWNDPSVRAVFQDYLVPLLQAGYFSPPTEWTAAVDAFWNEEYALYFMGSWITGMVPDSSDLGVFSLPEAPGAEGIVFAADYFFIPAYTDKLDEAKQLFQFLASAEGQSVQVQQGGHLATALGVSLTDYPAVDREVASLLEGKEVLGDLDDAISGDFQTTFWSQLQVLWVDSTQLDAVLDAIQAAVP